MILYLLYLKRLYDNGIILKNDFNKIISYLKIQKKNIDIDSNIYEFIISLVNNLNPDHKELLFYLTYYKELNICEDKIDLLSLTPEIKKDKISQFVELVDIITNNIINFCDRQSISSYDLEDDRLSLIYDRFKDIDYLLDYGSTTLLMAPSTWGWKTTTIMNIIVDALHNNDVKFLYFWTTEVTKEEFLMKFGSIVFWENLYGKYKKKLKLASLLRKNIFTGLNSLLEEYNQLKKSENMNKENIVSLLEKILKKVQKIISKIRDYYEQKKEEIKELEELIQIIKNDIKRNEQTLKNSFLEDYRKKELIEINNIKENLIKEYEQQIDWIKKEFKKLSIFLHDVKIIEEEMDKIKKEAKELDEKDIEELRALLISSIDFFMEFNYQYNKFFLSKEKELIEIKEELKNKKKELIKRYGDRLELIINNNIRIEDVEKFVEKNKKEWNKNLMVVIDYFQMMDSIGKFSSEMDKFQFIASKILSMSKMQWMNIWFLIASQVASKRDTAILTENDIKWFKNVINTFSGALAVYNLEYFLQANEREIKRSEGKKPLTLINIVKSRDWIKKMNSYFVYNVYSNSLLPLDKDLEKILNRENIFWRKKVSIKIAYYEDLNMFWVEEDENNPFEQEKNKNQDIQKTIEDKNNEIKDNIINSNWITNILHNETDKILEDII